MSYTELQRGAAKVALRGLTADPAFALKASTLRRDLGVGVLEQIKVAEADARAFNKDAAVAGAGLLSAEALKYHKQTEALIARCKYAQTVGDRAKGRQVAEEAEVLASQFESRVPSADQLKFIKLPDGDPDVDGWDERWSYIEYGVPLLRSDLVAGIKIDHPKNYAQQVVLRIVSEPPQLPSEEVAKRGQELRALMNRLRS